MKKHAFTLAETLITLAIIGVVAAMTIPTLMSKYQKHTYVVGLKRAYAQLNHAIKMLPISMDCPAGDYDCAGLKSYPLLNDTKNMQRNISKNLKTTKFCYTLNDENCSEIKKYYTDYYDIITTATAGQLTAISLADGSLYIVGWNTFYVDVNGLKGPNKLGRDIFVFDTVCSGQEKNGVPAGTVIPKGSKLDVQWKDNAYWYYWGKGGNWQCTTENVNNPDYAQYHHAAGSCTGRVLEEDAMNY